MVDYVALVVYVFIVNVLPAFMPPTWVILAITKLKDPSADLIILTIVGAISSTAGRAVLSYYSSFFRRFFSEELEKRAKDIKEFFEKKKNELFVGTFLYSLSPFPSNMIFIANGITKSDPKPIFAGFFIGRLISYYTLVAASSTIFSTAKAYLHSDIITGPFLDGIGIIMGLSVVLIDWKKITGKKNKKPLVSKKS